MTALFVSPAVAQTQDIAGLQRQVDELRAENEALKKELAELRATLKRLMTPPASQAGGPPAAQISIDGLAARGRSDAPVTVVEFADYHNPDCARFHQETFPKVAEEYVQTGLVRFVFKNFPDLAAHPQALKAHEAAACAGDQGRYWEMHDLLLADQAAMAPENLIAQAGTLALDTDLFRYCLTTGAHEKTILRDVDEGKKGGVMLTPVFAVGLSEPDGQAVKVKRVVVGSQPYPVFEDAIEAVLSTAGGDP